MHPPVLCHTEQSKMMSLPLQQPSKRDTRQWTAYKRWETVLVFNYLSFKKTGGCSPPPFLPLGTETTDRCWEEHPKTAESKCAQQRAPVLQQLLPGLWFCYQQQAKIFVFLTLKGDSAQETTRADWYTKICSVFKPHTGRNVALSYTYFFFTVNVKTLLTSMCPGLAQKVWFVS